MTLQSLLVLFENDSSNLERSDRIQLSLVEITKLLKAD